jgi:hypothetical protein
MTHNVIICLVISWRRTNYWGQCDMAGWLWNMNREWNWKKRQWPILSTMLEFTWRDCDIVRKTNILQPAPGHNLRTSCKWGPRCNLAKLLGHITRIGSVQEWRKRIIMRNVRYNLVANKECYLLTFSVLRTAYLAQQHWPSLSSLLDV